MLHIIWLSTLDPSTIAASTTCPLPDVCTLPQGGEDSDEQEHRPATEVAGQVERRHRRLVLASDRVQHTGERDVVDVVTGLLGRGPS